MWDKIINPKTGRKVSIYSNIGKRVINNYIIQLGGSDVDYSVFEESSPWSSNESSNINFILVIRFFIFSKVKLFDLISGCSFDVHKISSI